MSAVAYLSSYLARGKFLSAAFVMNMLKRLRDMLKILFLNYKYQVNIFVSGIFETTL
jgi:hypothetical protein